MPPRRVDKQLRYRATPAPDRDLPLGLRSCGRYRVPAGWEERLPARPFSQLFWTRAGSGALLVGGTQQTSTPGHAVLYRSRMPHAVQAGAAGWDYHFWTMDGPLAERILDGLGLVAGCYRAAAIDAALFDRLDRLLATPGPAAERHASALLYDCCCRLDPAATPAPDARVDQALELLHRRCGETDFGIAALAVACGLHRSQLSRRFTAQVGLSPSAYLQRLRLQQAARLLRGGSTPVQTVAARCGFADPDYFIRCFRRHVGCTPGNFRRQGP
ncbi:MAG: helix-turn-helix domain-containing protein [Planctomycetota bacterium]